MKTYSIRNITELRADFWRNNRHRDCARFMPSGNPKPQNEQPTDTRMAFVDFVDALARADSISPKLAQEATL